MIKTPVFFLILIIVNFYTLIFIFSKSKREKNCHLALGLTLISFIILYVLTVDISLLSNKNLAISIISKLQRMPSYFYIISFFTILIASIVLLANEMKYLEEAITRTSIKTSIDNLPMGLSFSTMEGVVILSNGLMNELSYEISGKNLENGLFFWEKIIEKSKKTQNKIEDNSEKIIVSLDNGETWSFARNIININNKNVIEILATNVTDLYKIKSKLRERNIKYEKINRRIHRYSKKLAYIKVKEGRLDTKVNLHNELGYILNVTRRASLEKNLLNREDVFNLWKESIDALVRGKNLREGNVFTELLQVAKDIGVKFTMVGSMPRNSSIKDFILRTTIEVLNNAVYHADATELSLSIKEEGSYYNIDLINNGRLPENGIVEGGGLTNLREELAIKGGEMGIDIQDEFKLWLKIPIREELDDYD